MDIEPWTPRFALCLKRIQLWNSNSWCEIPGMFWVSLEIHSYSGAGVIVAGVL